MKRQTFLSASAAAIATGCAGHNVLPASSIAGSAKRISRADLARLDPAKPLPAPAIIGEARRYDGNRDPRNWMLCDGRSLKIKEYPTLFDVLGHSGGRASKGHFKLPNSELLGLAIAVAGVAPTDRRALEAALARRPKPDPAIVGKPARAVHR
jgi:hypothetical protein